MWIIFLALMITFEALSDILAKEWEIKKGAFLFSAAIAGYVVTNIVWLVALRSGAGLTRGAILFSVGSAILAIIIGLLLYKEPVTRLQMFGIGLGMLSVILLLWE